jgi:hypothetical protein
MDSNLLAAGLDRYRTDHCVLVWDTQVARASSTVAEMGLSDAAHSLAWLYNQPRSLIVGMNNKHLKMVDLRGNKILLHIFIIIISGLINKINVCLNTLNWSNGLLRTGFLAI